MRSLLDYIAAAPYSWQGLDIPLWGCHRGFNFDGAQPFVNSSTGQADIASIQFDGQQINGANITNAGSGTPHITKIVDSNGDQLTSVKLLATDGVTPAGTTAHRTQINSYPLMPYRTYELDLEFMLDQDWDFNMNPGRGLLWQLKGVPKSGQSGNPALQLELNGNQLLLTVRLQPHRGQLVWPGKTRIMSP
jgi:hypothetical protein